MKKLLFGTIFIMLAIVVPISTVAQININIGIPLPPPIVFPAAPEVMVLPETPGVYVILILMWICIFGMVSGGISGKAAGTAHIIMTGTGATTTMFQVSIFTSIDIGEITTETTIGTDTSGTIKGFLMPNFTRTGRVGKKTNLGEDKKPGASSNIHLERKHTRRC